MDGDNAAQDTLDMSDTESVMPDDPGGFNFPIGPGTFPSSSGGSASAAASSIFSGLGTVPTWIWLAVGALVVIRAVRGR